MGTDSDKRGPKTFATIGAAMRVHSELGPGFLEAVYQEALEIELRDASIPHEREKAISIKYKGAFLSCGYKADFICFDEVLVELKALSSLTNDHSAQVINYLKATNLQKALLINFGTRRLDFKRFAN